MRYPYWDKITLGGTVGNADLEIARLNILAQIIYTDNQMLSSQYDQELMHFEKTGTVAKRLKWFFTVYFSKPDPTEKIISAINLIPLAFELLFKTPAAGITDLYVFLREKYKKSEGVAAVGWGILTVVMGACNLLIAQPLVFIANTISHVRTVLDGTLNFFTGLFLGDTKQAARGMQAFGRGFLSLLVDGLVAGAVVACTYIPGAQPAIPFLVKAGVWMQSLVASVVSVGSAAAQAVGTKAMRKYAPAKVCADGEEEKVHESPGLQVAREPMAAEDKNDVPGTPVVGSTPAILSHVGSGDYTDSHAVSAPVPISSSKSEAPSRPAAGSVPDIVGSVDGVRGSYLPRLSPTIDN